MSLSFKTLYPESLKVLNLFWLPGSIWFGKFFHLMNGSFIFCFCKLYFRTYSTTPGSYSFLLFLYSGNSICDLTFFTSIYLRQETWNTEWIFLIGDIIQHLSLEELHRGHRILELTWISFCFQWWLFVWLKS